MHDVLRPEPAEAVEKPMPHGLESQIRRVQNDMRNDGRPVSDDEALGVLAIADETKFRRDLALAESRMQDLGYTDDQCDEICAYIRLHNTVWGCSTLEEASRAEHAEILEGILKAHRTDLDMPPKRDDYKAIREILEAEGCEPRFVSRVLAIAKAHGTVDCDDDVLKVLKAEVRQKVEAAIPGISPWQWDAEFDARVMVPIRDTSGRRTYAGSTGYEYLANRGAVGYGAWND